jgi:aminopeptidase N
MTDQVAALKTLSQISCPQRERALDSFFRTHANDALVTNKWFTLQATIPEPETLERVRRLTKSHAFSFSNPNRVYGLIGAFANANPLGFNAADGSGYRFIAETALQIDATNPQVAARLVNSFRSWRNLEPGRRALARAALETIAARESLSPDMRDLVSRALA